MNPEDRKPIEFRQLCALLRSILQADPTIDDAEWKARGMDTLAKWGFQSPRPEQMGRAMSAVEQAMRQTMGPRPIRPVPEPPKHPPVSQDFPKEPRTHRPPGWNIVVSLMAALQGSGNSGRSSTAAPTAPRETLPISEVDALNEFWQAANRDDADRLELLKVFAEIAIVRPAEWDYQAIRDGAEKSTAKLSPSFGCFACKGEYAHWHHVLQIQFGGSNYVRNLVPLCAGCHSAIHPWLPFATKTGRTGGWSHIGSVGADVLEGLKKRVRVA